MEVLTHEVAQMRRIRTEAKLFGMAIAMTSGGMEVSLRNTTTKSMLETHVVSWKLFDTNQNRFLILLRHCDHFNVVLYPDHQRNRTTAVEFGAAESGLEQENSSWFTLVLQE